MFPNFKQSTRTLICDPLKLSKRLNKIIKKEGITIMHVLKASDDRIEGEFIYLITYLIPDED